MKIVTKPAASLVALAALLFAGSAHAQTVKTGHYSIDPAAMGADQVSSSTNYSVGWADGLRNAAGQSACFAAAVNLPHGGTVTRITVWYSSTAPGDVAVVLRQQLSDGEIAYVAGKEIGSTSGQRKALNVPLIGDSARAAESALTQKIDNARFSYTFRICLNGLNKAAFHVARITYTYVD